MDDQARLTSKDMAQGTVTSFMESGSLAYVFPHENLFIWAIGALIVGLLVLRAYVTSRRRGPGR